MSVSLHPARDLEWLCFSPSLLRDSLPSHSLALLPSAFFDRYRTSILTVLSEIDGDPNSINQWIASRPRTFKLGLYAQTLVEYLFHRLPEIDLLKCDLPVLDSNRRTLGALDFLIRERSSGQILHIEFAVKFYLQAVKPPFDQEMELASQWIGPEGRDRLDHKLERLATHQLPLASTPEGIAALSALGLSSGEIQSLRSFAWIRGRVFRFGVPVLAAPSLPSLWINPDVEHGFWLHSQTPEIESLLHSSEGQTLALPDKREWLTSYREHSRHLLFEVSPLWPSPSEHSRLYGVGNAMT